MWTGGFLTCLPAASSFWACADLAAVGAGSDFVLLSTEQIGLG